jgi:hypothetical protein
MTQGLQCAHQLSDGLCRAPIVPDDKSYSGFSHTGSSLVDWQHWASPTPYGQGQKETRRIFKKCAVCGKLPDENEAHIRKDGHKFRTEQ